MNQVETIMEAIRCNIFEVAFETCAIDTFGLFFVDYVRLFVIDLVQLFVRLFLDPILMPILIHTSCLFSVSPILLPYDPTP